MRLNRHPARAAAGRRPARAGLACVLLLSLAAGPARAGLAECRRALAERAPDATVVPARICPEVVADLSRRGLARRLQPSPEVPVAAGQWRAMLAQLEPGGGTRVTVHPGALRQLVADTRLTPPVPGFWKRLVDWLKDYVGRSEQPPHWLKALGEWVQANTAWLSPAFQGVLFAALVLVVAWILRGVPWSRLRLPTGWRPARGRIDAGRRDAGSAPSPETIARLAPADQAPALCAWVVSRWAASGAVAEAPRMTDGQLHAWLAAHRRGAADGFAELAAAAEESLYGGRIPDQAARERCFVVARRLGEPPATGEIV